jgi:two-component system cell cycle sensor histidine kinase/response regulator CckA
LSEKKEVLLVDDEPMLLKLGSTMLSRLNFEVTTATGGNEALEKIETMGENLDLMITDMQMPDLTGVQLSEIVREKYPNIKIAILTGLGGENNSILAKSSLEDVEIIGKPFRFADIENLVSQLF